MCVSTHLPAGIVELPRARATVDLVQPRPESVLTAPVYILGAGLTGLSAAHHLRGVDRVVLEKRSEVGGHARSERRDGFTFDVTGHWLHLRDPDMQTLVAELLPDQLVSVTRKTNIFSHGALLSYPFQANLHGLPLAVVQECLVAYIEAQREQAKNPGQPPKTFQAFAEARFGKGIARHFFVPYNTKLWGMHPDQLTADWVSRFIPVPDTEQIVGGALGLRQEGLGYNAQFLYPKAGGIDVLPRALLQVGIASDPAATLHLQTDIEEINPVAGWLKRPGVGTREAYRALVSTLPLPELIARMPTAPAQVREAAANLRWVRWRYLNVATRRPVKADYHWVYVPEWKYPFFRVGVFTNAVDAMAPPGCGALYVELTAREGPVDHAGVVAGLVEIGAIERAEDVLFTDVREIEYAYVVFDDAYAASTQLIHRWLESVGIRSCGRYGAWVYNSMEDSMIQGAAAARWARQAPGKRGRA